MSDELWFEEKIAVPESLNGEIVKSVEPFSLEDLASTLGVEISAERKGHLSADVASTLENRLQGTIRLHMPRWRPLDAAEKTRLASDANLEALITGEMASGASSKLALVLARLGVEFALPSVQLNWGRKWQFLAAWHRVFLWANSETQPRVLALYPERLYEGAPRTVKVEVEPKLKVEPVEFSLGKLSSDIMVGQVAAVILGFHGEQECSPFWEVRSGPKAIEGIYNFWLLLEVPRGIPVNLVALADADLQVHVWRIPIGPKERERELRPKIILQV
jgi:hypothetical protein